jgi:heat shock protein HslJ
MTNNRWMLVALAAVALSLSSCGPPAGNLDLDGTNWILVDMAGEPQVRGHLSCNSFSGSYSLSGTSLEFGLLMSTLMACVDDALMQQESRMFELIGQVEQAQLIEGRLHLVLADGNQLIFDPVE